MTSGFDSQLINTLQFSNSFNIYFGNGYKDAKGKPNIKPSLAVPFAPWFNQRFGRRWAIMFGSGVMVCGALIQGFSQHGKQSCIQVSS
jgi:MFS family permease